MRNVDAYEIAEAVQSSIRMLVRRLRQVQTPGELTQPESGALSTLDREGPTTSADLARYERITPQSMGATLAALQARGLIERRNDPDDGRRVLLSITKAGREIVNKGRGARTEQLARALAGFTADERRRLMAAAPLLERLARDI